MSVEAERERQFEKVKQVGACSLSMRVSVLRQMRMTNTWQRYSGVLELHVPTHYIRWRLLTCMLPTTMRELRAAYYPLPTTDCSLLSGY